MVMPMANRDLRLKAVSRPGRNRFRKTTALPGLLRRQSAQGAVGADLIEPVSEVGHPALDAPLRQARQDKAPPDAKGPECPLDLAIQIGPADSSLHRANALALTADRNCWRNCGPWSLMTNRGLPSFRATVRTRATTSLARGVRRWTRRHSNRREKPSWTADTWMRNHSTCKDSRSMCQTRLIHFGLRRWYGFLPIGRAIASLAGRLGRGGLGSRSTRCTVLRLIWTLARRTCRAIQRVPNSGSGKSRRSS